jgi:hypothetical protein
MNSSINATTATPEGLFYYEEYRILLCLTCHAGIRPGGASETHLRNVHQWKGKKLEAALSYISTLQLQDPHAVDLPPNGSTAISELGPPLTGYSCRSCDYLTSSWDKLVKHLRLQRHSREGESWKKIKLQTFSHGRCARYWIVTEEKGQSRNHVSEHLDRADDREYWIVRRAVSSSSAAAAATTPQRASSGAALSDQTEAYLRLLRQQERDRLLNQAATEVGSQDPLMVSPWIERTRWAETYRGARRDVLVALAVPPTASSQRRGLSLGRQVDLELRSRAEDERRLGQIAQAVDRLFDRCEETVKRTGHPILCWLRSRHARSTFSKPFQLVGRPSTRYRYRRLWKRFLWLALRVYRLPAAVRQAVLNLHLTAAQQEAMRQLWDDGWWREHQVNAVDGDDEEDAGEDEDTRGESESDEEDTESSDADSDITADNDDDDESQNRSQDLEEGEEDLREGYEDTDPLAELIFRLSVYFITEEFIDGQSSSSLLVYFSGVLGVSSDGITFRRARDFTPFLSALIYQQRLLFLEWALPCRSYPYLGRSARPPRGHLTRLNKLRRRYMCLGCLAPTGEFISLHDYGRSLARADGPAFRVRWSEDGETVYYRDSSLQMTQFRALGHRLLDLAETSCRRLMYDWAPVIDLNRIKDDLCNNQHGFSFVQHPANGLSDAYLQLLPRACAVPEGPLLTGNRWDRDAVLQYLRDRQRFLELLMSIMYCLGGQSPRGTEFFSLLHSNEPSAERAIYVYGGYLIYITRYHKSRRTTNQEFVIVRYLPYRAGYLLYYYLVYIRPFAEMLQRRCFSHKWTMSGLLFCGDAVLDFSAIPRPWTTADLTKTLRQMSCEILDEPIGVQLYRQLSIAITEKHIKQLARPFNRHDDRSPAADVEVAFAWQSGHRPLERGTNYGLDGAFPDALQPALLRVYEWASTEWHRYLNHQSTPPSTPAAGKEVDRRAVPFRPSTSDGPSTSVYVDQDAVHHPTILKRPAAAAALAAHSPLIPPAKKQKLPQLHSGGDRPSVGEDEASMASGCLCTPNLSPSRLHLDSANPSAPSSLTSESVLPPFLRLLPACRLLLCTSCDNCYTRGNFASHLSRVHKIRRRQKGIIVEYLLKQDLVHRHEDGVLPNNGELPIPGLSIHPGHQCCDCGLLTKNDDKIRRHCSKQQHSSRQVQLQTLFTRKEHVRYFVVMAYAVGAGVHGIAGGRA